MYFVFQSDVVETTEAELSGSVLKEFLNNSPDLFSQGESDHSVTEVKINMQELIDVTCDKGESNYTSKAKSDERKTVDRQTTNEHTSRFFDEMQRFDEENGGKLNLTEPSAASVKRNIDFKVNETKDITDSEEKIELDMSSDKKKKMGKKITDYFTKKSI